MDTFFCFLTIAGSFYNAPKFLIRLFCHYIPYSTCCIYVGQKIPGRLLLQKKIMGVLNRVLESIEITAKNWR